jgi:hypothetical protein
MNCYKRILADGIPQIFSHNMITTFITFSRLLRNKLSKQTTTPGVITIKHVHTNSIDKINEQSVSNFYCVPGLLQQVVLKPTTPMET